MEKTTSFFAGVTIVIHQLTMIGVAITTSVHFAFLLNAVWLYPSSALITTAISWLWSLFVLFPGFIYMIVWLIEHVIHIMTMTSGASRFAGGSYTLMGFIAFIFALVSGVYVGYGIYYVAFLSPSAFTWVLWGFSILMFVLFAVDALIFGIQAAFNFSAPPSSLSESILPTIATYIEEKATKYGVPNPIHRRVERKIK